MRGILVERKPEVDVRSDAASDPAENVAGALSPCASFYVCIANSNGIRTNALTCWNGKDKRATPSASWNYKIFLNLFLFFTRWGDNAFSPATCRADETAAEIKQPPG